jgi:hydrogenase nickel incorporation protein HypA/HybF
MHEQALMRDVIGRIVDLAETEGASSVTKVSVRLGALSHFTSEHFREHYRDAARGTLAEGAAVEATVDDDLTAADAQGVVVESVEVELGAAG